MIVDSLKNAALYYSVNPRLERAFEYLKRVDLSTLEPGKYEIEGKEIFLNLVERDLLYDKSASTIDRLIAPGPTTRLLDPRCPGRAGRYIGYRIVEAYRRNHPEATLPFLLSPEFYTSSTVLDEASYNPSPR